MDLSVSPAAQEEVPVGGRKRETIFFFCFIAKDTEQKSVKAHHLGQHYCCAKVCLCFLKQHVPSRTLGCGLQQQLCHCPQLSLTRACVVHRVLLVGGGPAMPESC